MCDAEKHLGFQKDGLVCKIDSRLVSNRGSDEFLRRAAEGFHRQGRALTDAHSGYWVIGYAKLVAKTVALLVYDAYENYRRWRFLRQLIGFMQKLSLKPVLGSERNVEEFEYILNRISRTDFRHLPQH